MLTKSLKSEMIKFRMTQPERVIEYLKVNGSLTGDEAKAFGIGNLGAVISKIRRRGLHDIKTQMVDGQNDFDTYKYAQYVYCGSLIKG